MKKILFSILAGLALSTGFSQTATNFTTNDCAGNSHTLFSELEAGQVIVMCWVMPCATCVAPALADASAVQSFASSHPGRVKFYLLDDTGGTTCSSLNSWKSTNGITSDATFQNTGNVIKMTDYGSTGMPKTVVLGGTNHTVFYNVNGTVSSSGLQTAITNALNSTTGVQEEQNTLLEAFVFPNPAQGFSNLTYTVNSSSPVSIDLYDLAGKKTANLFTGSSPLEENTLRINTSQLESGLYFVKLKSATSERTVKLSILR